MSPFNNCDHFSKTCIVHSYIEKNKIYKLCVKLHMLWGQQSAKKASNQLNYITSYFPGYGEFKKSLFPFRSLNSECVTCVCLQYKTTTIGR